MSSTGGRDEDAREVFRAVRCVCNEVLQAAIESPLACLSETDLAVDVVSQLRKQLDDEVASVKVTADGHDPDSGSRTRPSPGVSYTKMPWASGREPRPPLTRRVLTELSLSDQPQPPKVKKVPMADVPNSDSPGQFHRERFDIAVIRAGETLRLARHSRGVITPKLQVSGRQVAALIELKTTSGLYYEAVGKGDPRVAPRWAFDLVKLWRARKAMGHDAIAGLLFLDRGLPMENCNTVYFGVQKNSWPIKLADGRGLGRTGPTIRFAPTEPHKDLDDPQNFAHDRFPWPLTRTRFTWDFPDPQRPDGICKLTFSPVAWDQQPPKAGVILWAFGVVDRAVSLLPNSPKKLGEMAKVEPMRWDVQVDDQ